MVYTVTTAHRTFSVHASGLSVALLRAWTEMEPCETDAPWKIQTFGNLTTDLRGMR
jgi:hypothetical protein